MSQSNLENLKTIITGKMAMAIGLNKKVRFDLKDDGCIFVDNTATPAVINEDSETEADLTLITKKETLEKILNGTQDPNIAFMMGKLKVKGSMGLAMKLNSILED